jgi:hypothetical protein
MCAGAEVELVTTQICVPKTSQPTWKVQRISTYARALGLGAARHLLKVQRSGDRFGFAIKDLAHYRPSFSRHPTLSSWSQQNMFGAVEVEDKKNCDRFAARLVIVERNEIRRIVHLSKDGKEAHRG